MELLQLLPLVGGGGFGGGGCASAAAAAPGGGPAAAAAGGGGPGLGGAQAAWGPAAAEYRCPDSCEDDVVSVPLFLRDGPLLALLLCLSSLIMVFAVLCSEEGRLLKHEYWVVGKEHYWKTHSNHNQDPMKVEIHNVYAMGKELRLALLIDKGTAPAALKNVLLKQMRDNNIREPFFLSCLPAAVLAVHLKHYSEYALHQRPNHLLFIFVKEQVALAHAKAFLKANSSPTAEAYFTHMDEVFAFLSLGNDLKRQLNLPKDAILEQLNAQKFEPMPSAQFQREVSTASKFETFQHEFEPIHEAYETEYRAQQSHSSTRKGQPKFYDHLNLDALLTSAGLDRQQMTHAFQFEKWFITHFVSVNGEHQQPNANWKNTIMHILSAPNMRPLETLNPNSMLGVYVLCGRISDSTNPNYLPPARNFDWDSNLAFKAGSVNGQAQSKGDTVVRIMTAEAKKLGMGDEFLARHAKFVMTGMNWLLSPADPSTNTPFSSALLFFEGIVQGIENEAKQKHAEEERLKRVERAKTMQAQVLADLADKQARVKVTKECSGCEQEFEWYFPKGQDASSYVPVVKEGELNQDDYCKECLTILCKHCKGAMCVTVDQVNQSLCATCMDITCTFCNQNIQKLHLLGVKVCQGCSSTRVCDCGQLVPAYNLQYKKCTTCNVCFTCGKALPTPSEQTIRTCNDCVMLLEQY